MNRSLFLSTAAGAGSLALVGASPRRLAPRVTGTKFTLPTFAQIIAKWNAQNPLHPLDDPAPGPIDPEGDEPEAQSEIIAYAQPQYQTVVTYTGTDWGNMDGTAFTLYGPSWSYNVSWNCVKAGTEAAGALYGYAKIIISQGPKIVGDRLYYAAIDFDLGDLSLYAFAVILGTELGVPAIALLGGGLGVGLTIWGALGCPHHA